MTRLFSRAFYQDAVLPSVTKCPSVACSSAKSLGKQSDRQIGKSAKSPGKQSDRQIGKEPDWN